MEHPPLVLIALQHDAPYSEAFKAKGWDVALAEDAHRLYSVARHRHPAAIVLDTHLRRGGAETALSWLGANVNTAAIPVVVLSDGRGDAHHALMAAGAQHCLALDAKPGDVLDVIHRCAGQPPAPKEAPQANLSLDARLAALRASGLLGTPSEAAYDRLIQLAARLTGAPMAALSLIDRNRQYHKSRVGIAGAQPREVPLDQSLCQWVVASREAVVVDDAREHPVLKHNAAVRHMGMTAYAGVPVTAMGQQTVGALCVVDGKPRQWTPLQLETLTDVARLAEVLVARNMLAQPSAESLNDMKWYATAGTEAILGATRILRRDDLRPADRQVLLDEIDSGVRSLMQIRAAARAG